MNGSKRLDNMKKTPGKETMLGFCEKPSSQPSASDSKTRSQLKRLKKKEKKKKKMLEVIHKETVESLPDEPWELLHDLSLVETGTADISEEIVAVSEVLVLDGSDLLPEKSVMDPEEEKELRKFLNTLDISDGSDKKIDVYSKPVITIPDEIFDAFLITEEVNQTKEAIRQSGVVLKTSPKTKRKETSPVKFVTKIVEAPKKVLYSYTGLPIMTPTIVSMEEVDDDIAVVHCGEDRGFQPMDVILEEGSEQSDSASDKKRFSGSETTAVIITESEQEQLKFLNFEVKECSIEEPQSTVEIVLMENDSDSSLSNTLTFEGIRFIEEESVSSHTADDYEADVESAVESRRDTVIVESQDEDSDAKVDLKNDRNSRQNSTSSCTSTCTAKYLPPYSRSESEIDDWKSVWKSDEIDKEIKEVGKVVNVKGLKESLERDIKPILISKLTVMEFCEDPTLHERTWNKVVENTRKKLEEKSYDNKEVQTVVNPASLAVLAKESLLALPNGLFLSRKIGLPLSCPSSPPEFKSNLSFRRYSDTETCSELQFYNSMPQESVVEFSCTDSHQNENRWLGMHTKEPGMLVGLSPSQVKNFVANGKLCLPNQQEAEDLLDLHQKFIERRCYDEGSSLLRGRNLIYDSKRGKMDTPVADHVVMKQDSKCVGERCNSHVGEGAIEHGSVVSTIKLESNEEVGAVAKPYVLAHLQNATPYDQYTADLKRNASVAGARRGRVVRDMDSHALAGKQAPPSTQDPPGLARTLLDRFMNHSDPAAENSFLAEFQRAQRPKHSVEAELPEQEESLPKQPSVSDIIKAFETSDKSDVKQTSQEDVRAESKQTSFISNNYVISKNRDIAVIQNEPRRPSLTQEELFKQQMYDEYMSKLADRQERRQHNSIKIVNQLNDPYEYKHQGIEEEFINKVRVRQRSKSSDTSSKSDQEEGGSKRSSVILCGEADLTSLPKHLQEFFSLPAVFAEDSLPLDSDIRRARYKLDNFNADEDLLAEIDEALISGKGFLLQTGDKMIGPTFKANAPRPGVWSPSAPSGPADAPPEPDPVEEQRKKLAEEPIPAVWTPRSAQASPVAERKEFRPVNFKSPTLPRKNIQESSTPGAVTPPPWKQAGGECDSTHVQVPTTASASSLPKAPNPTVTLLQKAREGQIPRGAQYLYTMPDQDRNDYQPSEHYITTKSESDRQNRIELGPRQPVAGIGPTTREGIPIVLRSEVTGENREKWYKRMYDSLHKPGKDDDFVTVKYRTSPQRRALHGNHSGSGGGYQSEPEPIKDDRISKYATLDRRRTTKNKENEVINVTLPRRSLSREPSRPPPGRIENYQTGHSSISEIEANKWWDEVLEIFDRWLDTNPGADGQSAHQILAHAICAKQAEKTQPVHKTHSPKSFMTYALKESGYDSEPQLTYTKRDDEQTPLSPQEHKEAYKTIQKGGEIPLHGLRKPAPERPKDETEIEYFPLSPTLTRIRVHKQNITPLGQFPFPLPILNHPLLPVGGSSSYSQIQLYPNIAKSLHTSCTKKGSVYQFSRAPDSGIKLQTVGETEYVKIIPKPRKLIKNLPVYENLPCHSKSTTPEVIDTSAQHPIKYISEESVPTFADLKRTAPSLIVPATKPSSPHESKKGKASKSKEGRKTKKTKVPLSESTRREKPLSKVQRRLKILPDNQKKRQINDVASTKKKIKLGESDSLTAFIEAELGADYLPIASSDGFASDDSKSELEMNPIFDSMNPNFSRREADYLPYRCRSFSPVMQRKPSPPQRQSSRNSSTLRMWSKMMVSYPYHRSRIDAYDSNVKFLKDRLQRKIDSTSSKDEFGDDVETVRTVKKDRNGQMSIRTNRYVKTARPVSAGPATTRITYDQNGRRVLSETRQPTASLKTAPAKSSPKVSDTVLKSSTKYAVRNKSASDDDKGKVKVTVAITAKGNDSTGRVRLSPKKPTATGKVLSPSTSVSSFRSVTSGKSLLSERGSSVSSVSKTATPRVLSPSSTVSRISSISRTSSPSSLPVKKLIKKATSPITAIKDTKKLKKTAQSGKYSNNCEQKKTTDIKFIKSSNAKEPIKKSSPTPHKEEIINSKSLKEELDLIEQTNLIRSDSFFQHLFLREPVGKKDATVIERSSSVLERARRYQRSIERPHTPNKAESGNLNLVKFFLSQKRPVSSSKFKSMDRDLSASRSPSPSGRSRSFHCKVRKFDGSQFGDNLISFSPDLKVRSLSEPPMSFTAMNNPNARSISPGSASQRFSQNSDRVRSFEKASAVARARSAGDAEAPASRVYADSNRSNSSLNLHYDHPEYQAYVLDLLHSTKKNERFRELHKFYASLERIAELEKTASIGDLRPRLRNEEIIDYDRWKKLRTKERAEAELKALVGKLSEIQKEKDLIFRTCDVDAVRWKGDRGLRAKDRSVEDLKEQFLKYSKDDVMTKDCSPVRDNYKPLWRGSSIVNLTSNLNTTAASHRGRPVTSQELEKIKQAKEKILCNRSKRSGKGYSSLSKEEVHVLKSQLSEIYSQELKKKGSKDAADEAYIVSVPDSRERSPGESNLFVRCSSAVNADETLSTSSLKKDNQAKGKLICSVPVSTSGESNASVVPLPWKEELTEKKLYRRSSRDSGSSMKPLSEREKKRLSMTLSKEVLEKTVSSPKKSPVLSKETVGVVASPKPIRLSPDASTIGSPRTCYSLEMSEDGKQKNDFLLVLTPTEKDVEKAVEKWANGSGSRGKSSVERLSCSAATTAELESASASSETSIRTVIKNPVDVLKKVEYFEDIRSSDDTKSNQKKQRSRSTPENGTNRKSLTPAYSLENMNELLGEGKKFIYSNNSLIKDVAVTPIKDIPPRPQSTAHYACSPCSGPGGESTDSLFSYRSRSVSPDPTKYYRAYLKTVRGGVVRNICNKFESLEDLIKAQDNWYGVSMKKYASDPELTRDMLRRYGTDPEKVVVRGQETGDVQYLKNKYEHGSRGRSRVRRSPIARTPFRVSDRYMPRINVISKTAELQLQKPQRSRENELPASPEPFRSLNEYTREHGGYYYIGEVEKLRRKFEQIEQEQRMSLMGQLYTSTPDINELHHIAPYLGCSWVAHQHPEVVKSSASSPDLIRRMPSKSDIKSRPHSSSPVRPKQLPSILKNYQPTDIFANQKFDPTIHRPKYRYQPEPISYSYDRRLRWPGDACWRQWNRPTVTFKELFNIRSDLNFPEEILDSPRKYVESEVTIHYRSPVRSEAKEILSEEELARRQAEAMRRIYQEERRRKYLQELQDMNSRRHTDNFTPSQKSPIPLNRYDDFGSDVSPGWVRDKTPEPRLLARALYNFVGQTPRELSFRRGDMIHIRRQVDRNWCEGELGARIGLFPVNYVEMTPLDGGLRTTPSKPSEGQARAKFNFIAQSHLELSLVKGELVVLTRRVDENWWEGRVGTRRGIFPVSYVEVLIAPGAARPAPKPVASPAAHSLILNGGSGQASMGPHHYTPAATPTNFSARTNQALHIDTQSEPVLYRVVYSYKPVNADELELHEGDTVLVMEKCDDGWFVGSSQKTGHFGTFPGNYVQRI